MICDGVSFSQANEGFLLNAIFLKSVCGFDATFRNLYHCTVMSDKLPESIDPLMLAERRAVLAGKIRLGVFERLSSLVVNHDGDVEIELNFTKEGKRALIIGEVKATLDLECQSCLQGMIWPLDIGFKLGVVSSLGDAERLEVDCEPLIYDGDKISLIELIEDEILLVLPDYPRHEHDCIERRISQDESYEEYSPSTANNPFSVLAKLKKTGE